MFSSAWETVQALGSNGPVVLGAGHFGGLRVCGSLQLSPCTCLKHLDSNLHWKKRSHFN